MYHFFINNLITAPSKAKLLILLAGHPRDPSIKKQASQLSTVRQMQITSRNSALFPTGWLIESPPIQVEWNVTWDDQSSSNPIVTSAISPVSHVENHCRRLWFGISATRDQPQLQQRRRRRLEGKGGDNDNNRWLHATLHPTKVSRRHRRPFRWTRVLSDSRGLRELLPLLSLPFKPMWHGLLWSNRI